MPAYLSRLNSKDPDFISSLMALDNFSNRTRDTVYIFYVKSGQTKVSDILDNTVSYWFSTYTTCTYTTCTYTTRIYTLLAYTTDTLTMHTLLLAQLLVLTRFILYCIYATYTYCTYIAGLKLAFNDFFSLLFYCRQVTEC